MGVAFPIRAGIRLIMSRVRKSVGRVEKQACCVLKALVNAKKLEFGQIV